MARVTPLFKRQPRYGVTFLRQWRKKRNLTLEQAGERVGLSHAQLGRIERGIQPYNQPLLEALAVAYNTNAASLLIRDPSDPDGIWSVWDHATPGERKMIVDIAKTIVKTGT